MVYHVGIDPGDDGRCCTCIAPPRRAGVREKGVDRVLLCTVPAPKATVSATCCIVQAVSGHLFAIVVAGLQSSGKQGAAAAVSKPCVDFESSRHSMQSTVIPQASKICQAMRAGPLLADVMWCFKRGVPIDPGYRVAIRVRVKLIIQLLQNPKP